MGTYQLTTEGIAENGPTFEDVLKVKTKTKILTFSATLQHCARGLHPNNKFGKKEELLDRKRQLSLPVDDTRTSTESHAFNRQACRPARRTRAIRMKRASLARWAPVTAPL